MARTSPEQRHHIFYEPYTDRNPAPRAEWTVGLRFWMHKAVTLLSQLNPTEQNYALAINFLHAVMQICNDMRAALDLGLDKHASQVPKTKG
jgi:hypothetical protein